jgi:hypothetical protein
MVVNLELFKLESMYFKLVTPVRPRPSRQVRQTRSEDHVSGHKFRLYASCLSAVFVFVYNLGLGTSFFLDSDVTCYDSIDSDLQCTCTELPGRTRLFPAIS